MPLWRPYDAAVDSKVADINNVVEQRFRRLDHRGAVPAAFRQEAKAWVHFDIFAWNPATRPGRPEGGECQAARALYALLVERSAEAVAAPT